MEDKTILYAVIQTLNQIEVRGEQNLNNLLACIQTLTQLAHGPKTEEATADA